MLRPPSLRLVRDDRFWNCRQTNARGRDNSMFSGSAIKPMKRLTQVLRHLTLEAQTQAEWQAVSSRGTPCFLKRAPGTPEAPLNKSDNGAQPNPRVGGDEFRAWLCGSYRVFQSSKPNSTFPEHNPFRVLSSSGRRFIFESLLESFSKC